MYWDRRLKCAGYQANLNQALESMYSTSIFHTLIYSYYGPKLTVTILTLVFLYRHLSTALFHWIAHFWDFTEICCLPSEYCSFADMVLYSLDDDDDDDDDDSSDYDSNHHGNVNCHIAFLVCKFYTLWWLAYLPMGIALIEKRILAV